MNACESVKDLFSVIPGMDLTVGIKLLRGAGSMINYITPYLIDDFDLRAMISDMTAFNFYRHFGSSWHLNQFMACASDPYNHDPYEPFKNNELYYCPSCDDYFREYNQLSGVSVCLKCGRALSHVSFDKIGRLDFESGPENEKSLVSMDSKDYQISLLAYKIWKSTVRFDFIDIRECLARRYFDTMTDKSGRLRRSKAIEQYFRFKGLTPAERYYFTDFYFFENIFFPFGGDSIRESVLMVIYTLFGSYERFIDYMYSHNVGHKYPPENSTAHNFGSNCSIIGPDQYGLYEITSSDSDKSVVTFEKLRGIKRSRDDLKQIERLHKIMSIQRRS